MSEVRIFHGDSRDVLKTLESASIDSCVCDPPYALVSIGKRFGADNAAPAKSDGASGVYARASAGFMGQRWDTGETAFSVEFWAEVVRVLKPGGHIIAASGTRTYHRLACAIEDAGFEIRDMVSWLYGSGFPKSHDVSKGIDKAATGIIRGRAGRAGRAGQSFGQEYERTPKGAPITDDAARWEGWGTALKPACEPWVLARKPLAGTVAANVLAHGVGALNIDGCRIPTDEAIVATRNVALGSSGSGVYGGADKPGVYVQKPGGRWPANVIHDGSEEVVEAFPTSKDGVAGSRPETSKIAATGLGAYEHEWGGFGGEGSAARFFYSAKADAEDRLGSKHPTVKPVDLMAYLCRLVTPPGGTVLDPFAGSGSTGVACITEGFDAILIEREAQYVADIKRRIAWAKGEGGLTTQEMARDLCPAAAAGSDLPLFADADTSQPASQPASQPDADAGFTESSRTKADRSDRIEVVIT